MKRVGIDIETNLSHDKIHIVKTIDIDTGEIRTWKAASSLAEFIKDTTLIVAHNGIGFDFPVLMKHWNMKIPMNQVCDTLILSRLLEPSRESGHSLESWGEALGVKKTPYKKIWEWMNDRAEAYPGECYDNPIPDLLDFYCEGDVTVLRALFHKLMQLKEQHKFSDQSVELEHKVADIIAQQERNGFKLDVPYATVLLTDIKTKMDGIYEQMQQRWPPYVVERYSEKTGKRLKDSLVTFNPGSRKQVGEKLIELGWKPEKFTETGQPQVDETTLANVDFPEAKMIAEYFLLQKRVAQIESWIEAAGKDGRVHGRVITNGAVTGRMTHSSPNMAQVPNGGSVYGHECRECWTVEDDKVLVGCDASGLELRMLAHYMNDPKYTDAVVNGKSSEGTDIHTLNMKAAGLQTRDQSKTFIYAWLYGAGPSKIGSIVGGSAKEGEKLMAKFLAQTPSLKVLKDKVSKFAAKGYVPGLDGRKIWVRSEHSALNSLLQGAGAVVMKKALVIFNEKIDNNGWCVKMVANVHDEFQFEVSPDIADVVGAAARQSIIDAGVAFNLRCPLDGEFKKGKTWKQTH
jgi:DNA polymerase I-like protein with 3'-5' exonuclease and polymerase domains